MRDGARQQGVTVGRRLCHQLGGQNASSAHPVLDHHRAAQRLGQLGAQAPRLDVRATAGSKRHDDLDRPVGVGLSQGLKRQQTAQGAQRDAAKH